MIRTCSDIAGLLGISRQAVWKLGRVHRLTMHYVGGVLAYEYAEVKAAHRAKRPAGRPRKAVQK